VRHTYGKKAKAVDEIDRTLNRQLHGSEVLIKKRKISLK